MSDIIPVFLGADLNCYNFARAFHEAYGVESYAYGRYPMAPTKYSKIIHFTTVPDMDNEDTMLRILHEFAAQHKGKRLYLFGCTDDYAAMIIRRKAELTEYIAPGPAARPVRLHPEKGRVLRGLREVRHPLPRLENPDRTCRCRRADRG